MFPKSLSLSFSFRHRNKLVDVRSLGNYGNALYRIAHKIKGENREFNKLTLNTVTAAAAVSSGGKSNASLMTLEASYFCESFQEHLYGIVRPTSDSKLFVEMMLCSCAVLCECS